MECPEEFPIFLWDETTEQIESLLHSFQIQSKHVKQVYKPFPINALRSRDGYAKNHSNKVWIVLCSQGKNGVKQEVKHR